VGEKGGRYEGILNSKEGLRLVRMVVGEGWLGFRSAGASSTESSEPRVLRANIRRINQMVQNSTALCGDKSKDEERKVDF